MASPSGRHASKADQDGVNISPMIDMVFILLIFFIVTTVFVDERGFAVNTPTPSSDPFRDQNEPVVLQLSANGLVRWGNEWLAPESVGELARARLRGNRNHTSVVLQVDQGAAAGPMVRVIDALRLAQVEKVSVARAF
jgi:biopolymer transport protein ExbD